VNAASARVAAPAALSILYRDEALIVVNKPSGLLVHRGWGTDRVTAMSELRELIGAYVYPAHRLDRSTSGALVFVTKPELMTPVQASFEAGLVAKSYLALTRGITPEQGLIDHAIAKSKEHEKRPAQTAFRRLASFERYSLVLTRPLTGRLHQIRRHLKFIAHPIIGDTRYGKGEHNRLFRERFALHRIALHALQIRFQHPLREETIDVTAPLWPDLGEALSKMGFDKALAELLSEPLWQPDVERLPRYADP
jgi:tRNA pseudouridine65 synthase